MTVRYITRRVRLPRELFAGSRRISALELREMLDTALHGSDATST